MHWNKLSSIAKFAGIAVCSLMRHVGTGVWTRIIFTLLQVFNAQATSNRRRTPSSNHCQSHQSTNRRKLNENICVSTRQDNKNRIKQLISSIY